MDNIIYEIDLLVQILKSQKRLFTQKLKESPPGGLIRIVKRRTPVYMHSVPNGCDPDGTRKYAKTKLAKDSPLLKQLAIKEYMRIALKTLDHNIKCLEQAKAHLRPLTFETVFAQMRKPYHALQKEVFSLEFLDGSSRLPQHAWAAQPYERSTFNPDAKIHISSRGLVVRSRAELLIAEMLYRYDIPFRYEQVLHAGKYTLAPDFTFLDANGDEFYWEYCGMMSDPHYANRNLWKRELYESIGITEWTNMIYTYDLGDSIDMREIEAVIKVKILPRLARADA